MTTVESIQPRRYSMLIDGERIDAEDARRFTRTSPAHDVVVGAFIEATTDEVDRAVQAARTAFDDGRWSGLPGTTRARHLRRVAALVEERAEELARVEALESGKPISQARGEVAATAELWYYAATLAQHAYGDSHNALGSEYLGLALREPAGVVGIITPWNFPLLIVSQKLPFALAVGCTAVVKPSQLTPGTTLLLGELVTAAGLPDGVVNIITGKGGVGSQLSEHPLVDVMSFTGSTEVGKKVMAAAAQTLKRVELELGGKNPQVVFPGADLDAAVDAVVFGVLFNQGECCNSGSRLLVHRDIADDFVARVVEKARRVVVGDPLDDRTKVGAIASQEQLDTIERLVGEGVTAGAELLLGGHRLPTSAGRFYAPTVLDGVTPDMSVADTEIFGPVLSVLRFDSLDEAVSITNSTPYGLSAGVWTRDVDTAVEYARRTRAGTVWVNCFMDGFPELSFGGYGESGLGRELGRHAIEAFTELKSVVVHTGPRRNPWIPADGAN
ncbi:acyl-CoA reductase-like NAD-dependent aldehyde dehydrogenase [Streptomyces sp. SLBN-118]|uniref:aldehyde dehydrogenase family protein n=1 Tax=Streptomyces sp. SLBN-118 TaxID=2768454 RepID=UPI0011520696|nr:aldehyde dehydrogenase family protein [Streptomyces sp. SLBN-118]TQK51256.1 acyl-CoA reductase-like NAD-dependent aldehyde dehydrogenase [Streptomyces sp. SLBN-118]